MFHGNPQHTGQSPFSGPTLPVVKWTFQTSGGIYASPVVSRGRIYVNSADGTLYALNLQGRVLWTSQVGRHLDGALHASSPAIGPDGTVYLAGCIHCNSYDRSAPPEGILYALTPGGQLKWNLTISNSGEGVDTLTSPTIGPDGTIYVSDVGFRVVAVSPDGTLKWQFRTNGEVVGSPAVAPDGTVYVGVDDPDLTDQCVLALNKCLLALNPDGTLKWGTLFLQTSGFSSPAVGSDGSVYVDGSSVASSGTQKWRNPKFTSPSIGGDGAIYGSIDNNLTALNPDGSLRWEFPIAKPSGPGNICCFYGIVTPTSAAIGANGILHYGVGVEAFCSCGPVPYGYGNATLYALAPNGSLAWKFTIQPTTPCDTFFCPSAFVSDPAIGSDGTIYVGTGDGNLYAVG
jgi:outer membrane protein assembly factor BamB